jgi:hypothetical protein
MLPSPNAWKNEDRRRPTAVGVTMPFRLIEDPDVRQAASSAYVKVLARLGIDGLHPKSGEVALKIISLVREGVTDPEKLTERTIVACKTH